MKQNTLIDSLSGITPQLGKCVALFSGGLDSSLVLKRNREAGVETMALHVLLTEDAEHEIPRLRKTAELYGAEFVISDARERFVGEFVKPAIRARASYFNRFPICSSLSRPLMAEVALEVAHSNGCGTVIHTATYTQNSAARFNNSLCFLDREIQIAAPFIKEAINRESKLRELIESGYDYHANTYSVDTNLWGRVIEAGVLDDPSNSVPDDVWDWTTKRVELEPKRENETTIGFEHGVPVSIDGLQMPLRSIIQKLNATAGALGIGRYNSVEDTAIGIKNHEVRETPAANVIFTALAELEASTLSFDELRTKHWLNLEWTNLAVKGDWHSRHRTAINSAIAILAEGMSGEIGVVLTEGRCFVSRISAPHSPSLSRIQPFADRMLPNYPVADAFEISRLTAGAGA